MVHQLTLNGTRLSVTKPAWLFASTCKLLNRTGLIVYKSVMLRDSDPMYEEVRSFLGSRRFELAWKGMFIDVDMMFGEGELSIQLTPADGESADVDPELVEELRAEGLRIMQEMTTTN